MVNQYTRAGSFGYMSEFPDFRLPQFDINSYNQRFRDASIVIDARASRIHYDDHWGSLSLKCAFRGTEHYHTTRTHYAVDDQSFLVLNEGVHYSSWIDEPTPVDSFTLNLAPAFVRDATTALRSKRGKLLSDPFGCGGDQLQFLECLYPHGERISHLMADIRRLARNLSTHHLLIEERFFELFMSLLELQDRSVVSLRGEPLRSSAKVEQHQRLLRARDFISSCFREDLSLLDIAQVACLNKFHLLRLYKLTFGKTPHQHLTELRLQAAARQLKYTSHPIATICTDVGFPDVASFTKLFKRNMGYSPGRYRKKGL